MKTMKHSTVRRALFALSIAAAIAWSACGDEKKVTGPGVPSATVSGVVYTFAVAGPPGTKAPLAGAKLLLVRDVPLEVVAGPAVTAADGRYSFPGIAPGSYALLIYTGNHLVADGMDARVIVAPGSAVQTHDVNMIPSGLWSDAPPYVAGTVTDAATGRPIANAFVSTSSPAMPTDWQGIITDASTVTDAQGTFRVHIDPLLAPGRGLLSVAARGYDVFAVDSVAIPPTDTLIFNVALTRGGATGTITGRVLVDGRPRAGVAVGLESTAFPSPGRSSRNPLDEPQRAIVPGKSVRTDGSGNFAIAGVTPGQYAVHAAYLPDDGLVEAEPALFITVTANGTVSAGDRVVAPAIEPTMPARGALAPSQTPTLVWTAVPGAARYRVSWAAGHVLENSETVTQPQVAVTNPLVSGTTVRWIVTALDTTNAQISMFDAVSTFFVP